MEDKHGCLGMRIIGIWIYVACPKIRGKGFHDQFRKMMVNNQSSNLGNTIAKGGYKPTCNWGALAIPSQWKIPHFMGVRMPMKMGRFPSYNIIQFLIIVG